MSAGSRFVWFDLMTLDVEGAKAFYSKVIGWKTKSWEGSDYEMWLAGDQPVGGLMTLPEEARSAGAPPHWLGYVGVNDVDAAARKTEERGGRILRPGEDISGVGRFAILADPQGAVFAVFAAPQGSSMPPPATGVGHVAWDELNTTDWKAAWTFYSGMFAWQKVRSADLGPEFGEYFVFGADAETGMGGMSNAATMMKAPPHWLYYIHVADIDRTVKTIGEAGGKVLNGPMEVPGGDRVAQCQDPQGAHFAIVQPKH